MTWQGLDAETSIPQPHEIVPARPGLTSGHHDFPFSLPRYYSYTHISLIYSLHFLIVLRDIYILLSRSFDARTYMFSYFTIRALDHQQSTPNRNHHASRATIFPRLPDRNGRRAEWEYLQPPNGPFKLHDYSWPARDFHLETHHVRPSDLDVAQWCC